MRGSSVFSFISCHLFVLPKKTLLRTVTLSSAVEIFPLLLAKESLRYKLLGMKSFIVLYCTQHRKFPIFCILHTETKLIKSLNNTSSKHLTLLLLSSSNEMALNKSDNTVSIPWKYDMNEILRIS